MQWQIRVHKEREGTVRYVCETPVLLEQRIFAIARAVQGAMSGMGMVDVIRMGRLIALAMLVGALVAGATNAAEIAEPPGYKLDDYRSPTPATLGGLRVVTPGAALTLWREGKALFIDVLPRPVKPSNLPEGTVWHDKPRPSIPRAVWLANVGYGKLAPEMDAYFRRNLETLTGGDRAKPLVFFCLANCWMSWNAAKRAREEYGYTAVTWFPEGTDGWPATDAPLVEVQPAP